MMDKDRQGSYRAMDTGEGDVDELGEYRLSLCQRFGIGTLCLVMTCYFIPMLSFIPLALFGGLQTPSPWDGNYNKEAPKPTIPAEEMPSGRWYWNLPLVSLILLLVPSGIIFAMYQLKMRSLRSQGREHFLNA